MLDAPETACCDGAGLCARRHVHGCGGAVGHAAEGAEKFGQEGHGQVGEEYEEEECEELQIGRISCKMRVLKRWIWLRYGT